MTIIGSGSSGTVYLEWRAGHPVAVKKMCVPKDTPKYWQALFECSILQSLKHRNLVAIHDIQLSERAITIYNETPNSQVKVECEITMEFHRRGSLEKYLPVITHESTPKCVAVGIFIQVLKVLQYLHNHSITHGGIKPADVLLDNRGYVKLADFGDARLIGSGAEVFDKTLREKIPTSTQFDDLEFTRFTPTTIQLGLIPFFKALFKVNEQSKRHMKDTFESFYRLLLDTSKKRFEEKDISVCQILLNHPFLNTTHLGKCLSTKNILFLESCDSAFRTKLASLYSSEGIKKFQEISQLFSQMRERTTSKDFSELTTIPLSTQPPIGFQRCHIEFPLRSVTNTQLENYQKKKEAFLFFLRTHDLADSFSTAWKMAEEAYRLLKSNGDPTKSAQLFIKNSKGTYKSQLQYLHEQNYKIIRIYSDEKCALSSIIKVPRAYIAIEQNSVQKKKVFISFMGAEVFPRMPETWWSNDPQKQPEIWAKTNFNRSYDTHTGLMEYAQSMCTKIEKALSEVEISRAQFTLTGHSTGGVLTILTALHLQARYPSASIHSFAFATPAFMNEQQCDQLKKRFSNNKKSFLFHILSLQDPVMNFYGPRLHQPDFHTIYIKPPDFSGKSFQNIYAASIGTTQAHMAHHSLDNYSKIVSQLTQEEAGTITHPSSSFGITSRL